MSTPQDLRDAYLATVIEIELEPGFRCGPRHAAESLHVPIFIITACNPFSESLPHHENAHRMAQLLEALEHLDVPHHPAIGSSADGTWSEESYAISLISRELALELGRRFGQHAIFEITNDAVTVLGSDGTWSVARPNSDQER